LNQPVYVDSFSLADFPFMAAGLGSGVYISLSVDDEAQSITGFPASVPVIYKSGSGVYGDAGITKPKTLAITTAGSGISSFKWLVDGTVPEGGNNAVVSIDAATYGIGGHTITLIINEKWSKELSFTVAN